MILNIHFLSYISGTYWNDVINIDIERHKLSTVDIWFLPKQFRTPEQITRVVTMHIKLLEGNCVDMSPNIFTHNVVQTIYILYLKKVN